MRIQYVLALVIALIALPIVAQSNDVGLWYSTAKIKNTAAGDGRLTFNDAKGYGVSYNHFWTRSLSTEFSGYWLRAQGAIDVNGSRVLDVGKLELKPVVANVQWHFARSSMFSPYIGAGVAWVRAGNLSNSDLDLAGIGTVKIDKKVTYDGNAGVIIGFGSTFAVAADAKYIKYEPDAKAAGNTEKLKLNPLVISVGLKLRW
jgi:outer membrane protein W